MTLLGEENKKEISIGFGTDVSEDNNNAAFYSKDGIRLGESSKISTLAKEAMTLKTVSFADSTTFHGLRYIFMRNISLPKRYIKVLRILLHMRRKMGNVYPIIFLNYLKHKLDF